MVVYEMYLPTYMQERNLNVNEYMIKAPFMLTMMSPEARIYDSYTWFQRPDNIVRQKIDLIDTRSPELLYKVQSFMHHE